MEAADVSSPAKLTEMPKKTKEFGAITAVTRRRLTARLCKKEVTQRVGSQQPRTSNREAEARANAVLVRIKARLDATVTRTIDFVRQLDVDGDGVITHEEFRTQLRALGVHPSDEDFNILIFTLDANMDGDISVKEFDRAMKRADKIAAGGVEQAIRPPPKPSEARIAAAEAALCDDAKLDDILEELSRQKYELQAKQDWQILRKSKKELRDEALARSRFVPEVAPWAATSFCPREFGAARFLPAKYLEPRDASNATRPVQCYEPQPEVPFRHAVSQVPRVFGEVSRPLRSKTMVPPFAGDSPTGEGPEFPMSARPHRASPAPSPRLPRHTAPLSHISLSQAQPEWRVNSHCVKLGRLQRLDDRVALSAR
eukprot:TRINITY_DN43866_c0_g1_i1.p1 TRINITY_DN43866_c0_g1~~TRINITY_DN43866_c0_g1_i1.p1  ORF type:complete len:370 (-),score=47.90 TRINITY_DN43866_c0_g1_i1:134-1243(-)